MGCGIMRIEKRGRSAVYGLQLEANRTAKDHNEKDRDFARSDIDWDKTDENIYLRRTENWNAEITRQIHDKGLKERKDSIVMIDGLYTASPEFFEGKNKADIKKYFEDCLDFHERTYGKVFNAVIHFDEKTPHLQVASVPLVEDEKGWHLSAKIIMGNRNDYRLRQDSFFDEVTKNYGLERGEIHSPEEKRVHLTKREWQVQNQAERIEEQNKKALNLKATKGLLSEAQVEEVEVRTRTFNKNEVVMDKDEAEDLIRTAKMAESLLVNNQEAHRILKEGDEIERKAKEEAKKIIAKAEEEAEKMKAKAREEAEGIAEQLKSAKLEKQLANANKIISEVKEIAPEVVNQAKEKTVPRPKPRPRTHEEH